MKGFYRADQPKRLAYDLGPTPDLDNLSMNGTKDEMRRSTAIIDPTANANRAPLFYGFDGALLLGVALDDPMQDIFETAKDFQMTFATLEDPDMFGLAQAVELLNPPNHPFNHAQVAVHAATALTVDDGKGFSELDDLYDATVYAELYMTGSYSGITHVKTPDFSSFCARLCNVQILEGEGNVLPPVTSYGEVPMPVMIPVISITSILPYAS